MIMLLTEQESKFAHFFNERSTDAVAHSLFNAFRIGIRELVRADRLKLYAEFDHAAHSHIEAYDAAVSLSQGAKTISGNLFNELVAYGVGYLFANWEVKVEQKVKVGGKKDIDQLCLLPKGDIYFSATTSPQERKDGTWAQEYSDVVSYRRVHGDNRPFCFVGVFGESKCNCKLSASIYKREKLQQLMPYGVEVVCLHDTKHSASTLSSIIHKFI